MSEAVDVLCAGIIVADHVCSPISHLPAAGELVLADKLVLTIGGCAANVAVDLVKQSVRAAVAGLVGADTFGLIVTDMLSAAGVDVSLLHHSRCTGTSQTLIINVVGQDRRFVHSFGANGLFQASSIPLEQARRCRILYLGGYLLMESVVAEELRTLFAEARKAGVKTVLDVVTPGPADYLPRLVPVLPEVDVFLPNDHEAELITGEKDPFRQAETLHRLGTKTTIITLGDRGAVLLSDRIRLRANAFTLPFVDGSGGGDAFAAGYMTGMLQGLDEVGCLRLASALGASCVRALGTTTGVFTRDECTAFLKENTLTIKKW